MMKNKILARVLSVLLCVCVFCGSFTLTAFAVGTWFDGFINSYPNIISLTNKANNDKFAKQQTCAAAWRKVIKDYNIDRHELLDLFNICWAADSNTFISKYGSDVYNKHFDNLQNLVKVTMSTTDMLAEDYLIYLYSDVGAHIDDNGKVQVPASDVKDYITDANTMFFPKNTGGKMSYRTDKRWHNKYDGTSEKYLRLSLYESFNGFTAVGGDEIYFIFFYKTADDIYYGSYQFHLTVTMEEKWFEDRDEVEFTYYQIKGEYWDMVEGSADKRTDFTPTNYYTGNGWADFATNTCQYFDLSFLAENYSVYTFGLYNDLSSYNSYNHLPRGSIGCNWPVYPSYNSDMSLSLNIDGTLLHNFDMSSDYTDIGYLASTTPIETIYKIDTSKIPDNYYITIQGDNIYDYSITNPETGQSDTINNYITNNYTYVTNNGGDNSGSGSSVGGNVTVGGKVDIGGSVGVDINVSIPSIDININNGNGSVDYPDINIVDNLPESPQGFSDYLKILFDFLPAPVLALIIGGIAAAIFCRIWGR